MIDSTHAAAAWGSLWKRAVMVAMIALVIVAISVAFLNLPIISGVVPN